MTQASYKTVYIGGVGEIEEKKSRFIATVQPVETEEEAVTFMNETKKKYWDAKHNCSAFVIGSNQELTRCSDDGEPAQTAGRPMLDVLLKEELHNAAVVVTRYFGGTLLGTGGLVRAYQKSVQAGLAASTIIEKMQGVYLTIQSDYSGMGQMQYLLAKEEISVLKNNYTEQVEIGVVVPIDKKENIEKKIMDATSGKSVLVWGDKVEYAYIEKEIKIF